MNVARRAAIRGGTFGKRLDKIIPAIIEQVELPLGFTMTQTLDLAP